MAILPCCVVMFVIILFSNDGSGRLSTGSASVLLYFEFDVDILLRLEPIVDCFLLIDVGIMITGWWIFNSVSVIKYRR